MINISIEFDWEAAKLDVTDYVLDPVVGATLRYKNEDGEAAHRYLSTQYFDQTGLRFYELENQAINYPNIAQDTMRKLMTVWLAQKAVYDEATANNAFGLWREGNHDT
tara:strand:+ start:2266 stop:2589 length:324 start_codon:yes stop_codon:yes gene_type:complete